MADLVGDRDERGRGGVAGLTQCAGGDGEAETIREGPGDLGERDPQAVVHPRRPRLGVRPDLRARGTQRVRGLLRVAALHPPPTRRARADPDPEPCRQRCRHRREIGVELVGVTLVYDTATTMRATRRQRRVERAVRIRWGEPMTVTAMQAAALTARRLRVDDRVALAEWGRLPLPRPTRLLQQPLQLHDPSLAISDRFGQTSNGDLQLGHHRLEIPDRHTISIRTPARPHADPLSKDPCGPTVRNTMASIRTCPTVEAIVPNTRAPTRDPSPQLPGYFRGK